MAHDLDQPIEPHAHPDPELPPDARWGDEGGGYRRRGDGGYVMAMVALLIIPMTVLVAFAVDLGAWYAQGVRQQRAADMAAMAGVVWVPNNTKAQTEATATLAQNGYTSTNATIAMSAPTTTRYKVTVTQTAPRFFSRVLNLGTQTLTRSATAEYNKPIPLGSPTNRFGNNLNGVNGSPSCTDPSAACAGTQPQLWASVNGPYTRNQDGDQYSTKCPGNTQTRAACDSTSTANGAQNDSYRPSGWLYAIETPTAGPVTVQLYDFVHSDGRTCSGTVSVTNETGDAGFNGSTRCNSVNGQMPMEAELFNDDGSDLTITYDETKSYPQPGGSFDGQCTSNPGRIVLPQPSNNTEATTQINTYKNKWVSLCTFNAVAGGVYPLRVRSSAIPGISPDVGRGWNQYSVRATVSSGTSPRIYGVGDMSIYNNASTVSRFYLADVGPENAGKQLILDLYDPGDGSGSPAFVMTVQAPPGGAPNSVPTGTPGTVACNYNSSPSSTRGGATLNANSSTCSITTKNAGASSGIYNGGWLRVQVSIPTTYNCTTDCWWTIKYNLGSGATPTDRTVWAVTVLGDPVHLVE